MPRLSPGISHLTYSAAYAPFTPSNSGQRSPPTCYRGCWHVVSRGFLLRYRPAQCISSLNFSSLMTELYNPKAFFAHAASLRQAFAHCAISPTAASRRSLGRISVPVWPVTLSGRLPVIGLVGLYPANYLMGRSRLLKRFNSFPPWGLSGITPNFLRLFPSSG